MFWQPVDTAVHILNTSSFPWRFSICISVVSRLLGFLQVSIISETNNLYHFSAESYSRHILSLPNPGLTLQGASAKVSEHCLPSLVQVNKGFL